MKKIYNILLTFVALLAFAPVVGAQTPTTINEICADPESGEAPVFPEDNGTYETGNNVGYSKVISKPQSDGTYWIKLEAFSTGSATVTQSSQPSDCVLVLDLSSSMSSTYVTRRTPQPETSYTYNNYPGNLYYKHTDGNYYQVSRGGNNANRRYLRYSVGGTDWYLSGTTSTTTDTRFGSDDVIFTGVLYGANENVTRLQALKEACIEFVESLATNAAQSSAVDGSFPGNRVAIVTYSGDATPVNSTSYIIDETEGWKDVTSNKTAIESAINGFNLEGHSGTRPDLGLKMVVDKYAGSVRSGASFSVLVFTDGYPVQSYNNSSGTQIYFPIDADGNHISGSNAYGTGATRFTCLFADDAIYYAHVLKDTYNATVFSVGLIESVAAGNTTAYQNYRRVLYQMDMISSNYPDSEIALGTDVPWNVANNTYEVSVSGLTTGTKDAEGNYFQLVDENTDLSTIFKQISEMSSNPPASMSSSSTTVDVVSSSFMLPPNATASSIKLFTAKCTNSDTWTFDREYVKGSSPHYTYNDDGTYSNVKVDATLKAEVDTELNKIEVTGFAYDKNWCGPVTSGSTTTYRGYKVIILIPIRMNPDAVGGPNVATNGPGSGIINDKGENVMPFESPHVSLPVNVYIEKAGLDARESAKFRIERALIPSDADGNPVEGWKPEDIASDAWEYVSTVFVTNSPNSSFTYLDTSGNLTKDSNPMVRVKGMPATKVLWWEDEDGNRADEKDATHTIPHQQGLVYKISEEPWSWSYTAQTGPQYTVTDKVDNPFTFTNAKRTAENIDVTVRHAESKVMNVFKGKSNVGTAAQDAAIQYDDSKKNVGREDYYLPPEKPAATAGEGGEGGEGGESGEGGEGGGA